VFLLISYRISKRNVRTSLRLNVFAHDVNYYTRDVSDSGCLVISSYQSPAFARCQLCRYRFSL